MNLTDGIINETYRVIEIENLDLPVERRLEAMGLTTGTNVTILNKKNKGAVMMKVRGTRFAIGQHIAQGIKIEEAAR